MFRKFAAAATLIAALPVLAHATPSTVVWTPATTYIQPFAVPHITYDSYFNGNKGYPTDTGLTMGILPFDKLQAEVGVDVFAPQNAPRVYLNGKIGTPEDSLFKGMPGITAGVYGYGTDKATRYNVIHAEIGKTLPYVGTLAVGVYKGNPKLLLSSNTVANEKGLMVSWYRGLDELTNKLGLGADFASGKNGYAGAGAVGLYIWPVSTADIILGVVKFNDPVAAGLSKSDSTLYTVQTDIDLDFKAWFAKAEAPAATPLPVPAAAPAPATGATN